MENIKEFISCINSHESYKIGFRNGDIKVSFTHKKRMQAGCFWQETFFFYIGKSGFTLEIQDNN